MQDKTAQRLKKNIDRILSIWESRVNEEIQAAQYQGSMALRNSLPDYLHILADSLSNLSDRTSARKLKDKIASSKVGKKHGGERASCTNYTISQLITEYHILRQVLCDVLEEEGPLSEAELEFIICSIEQAVNDSVTEYTDTLKDVRNKMTNTLAHDLRNPLTSTKISAQLVLRKVKDDDALVSKMKLIVMNMDRLDLMIKDLLDVGRIEAGQSFPLEIKSCDFNSIIQQAIEDLSLSCENCFEIKTDGECIGYWDESGLRRIVENLTTNAVKYGDEKELITISLLQDKTSVELSVHNWGPIIPPEEKAILFEQYRRLKSSQAKTGWGLGLTMVKDMVDAHKGSIIVESEENKGTTFIVKLPRDARSVVEDEKEMIVEHVPRVPKDKIYQERH